ncbi:hypothetical protein BI347_00025 [Chromobacterium sphagni]|uniref:Uncharacterized protein n=1 Tax=Chromobacterium sphagni TaxID=1903179 RepID=A0A1S1WXR9_9NEIS|nr:tetratricopeptide repeat protein [Chromobacterium sphagni]OHX12054.1 hypothetical protein BI347_00025 [Chromobacterium sphagni]
MNYAVLDQEELFRLALHAMENQQHAEAIALLKQGLSNDDQDARLHYLLGVEYAQIGMPERGVEALERAVALRPALEMAVFQLGLLYLTQGQPDQAVRAWQGLDPLPEESPLQLFRQGLQHLIRDEFSQCRSLLTQGIAANQAVPVLNADMARILQQLEPLEEAVQAGVPPEEETQPAVGAAGSLFLRGYAASGDDPVQ